MADKPRKLIVHAGMHKTGSTAIQYWLQSAKMHDSHYFKWRKPNHSDLFVLLFEENPQKYFTFAQAGYTRERAIEEREVQKERILKQLEESSKGTFIFSAERISTAPKNAVVAMREFFSEHFDDIQVYAYARKPSGFMTSMFQQHLKTGHIMLEFGKLWPGYRGRLGRLFDIFGEENVHLRSFDQLAETGAEVVGDFAKWAGLSIVPPSNIVRNKSMSATGMSLLFFYRKLIEPEVPDEEKANFNNLVLETVQKMPGEAFLIELDHDERQKKRVARDLAWVSRWTGLDFNEIGFAKNGVRVFRDEDDILNYAVSQSHHLLPGHPVGELDPTAPGSVAETRKRFATLPLYTSGLRTRLRAWLKNIRS